MASRYSSAASGLQTGAQIGGAVGSLVPIVGTAMGAGVGAGLGAIGGAVFGGPSEVEQARLKRLQELQRRQELGTLGFTDEEINARLGAAQGQAQQQMQGDRQQQAALLGAQDLGAGSFAKGQQAQAQREQTVMAQLASQVQQENMQIAAQQQAELAGLQGLQAQADASNQAMLMAGVAGGVEATAAAALQEDRSTAILQIQTDLEGGLLTVQEADLLFQQQGHGYSLGGA